MMNKKRREVMFSSESVEWFTPPHIYRPWDQEYHFTTDLWTDSRKPLGCKVFYTKEEGGLAKPRYGNVFVTRLTVEKLRNRLQSVRVMQLKDVGLLSCSFLLGQKLTGVKTIFWTAKMIKYS